MTNVPVSTSYHLTFFRKEAYEKGMSESEQRKMMLIVHQIEAEAGFKGLSVDLFQGLLLYYK